VLRGGSVTVERDSGEGLVATTRSSAVEPSVSETRPNSQSRSRLAEVANVRPEESWPPARLGADVVARV
jgi:hypothetical protein